MIFDFDDHHPDNDALPRLERLREIRPDFKCTLFAVAGLGRDEFWDSHPDWVELAMHGWKHPDPMEAAHWDAYYARLILGSRPKRFVKGWKSPGWQISDGTYDALLDDGWWVADQHYNDDRRPAGLRVHCLGDGEHWHGHVQNVCGNGLEETWDHVVSLVEGAESFEFVSEVVR